MIRLTLVDEQGNAISHDKLATVAEPSEAQEKARALIRECDRLTNQRHPNKTGTGVPYA